MNRTRTSTLDAFGLRDQRNRIYPTMEGSDGSTLSLDFTAMSSLDSRFTFTRSSTATRINSSGLVETIGAAATNDPTKARFDHDPTTLTPRGLLIEGSATNLAFRSNALNSTGANEWSNANCLTPSLAPSINDPAGGTNTWKVIAASGSAIHSWRNGMGGSTMTSGTAYTISVWAKPAEYDRIIISDPGGGTSAATFVMIGSGTATAINNSGIGTCTSPTMVPYPNGWWRCFATFTRIDGVSTNRQFGVAGYPSGASTNAFGSTYNGDGTSGVYIYGWMMETGSGASSYIATGASTATRAADSAVMTGTNFSSWFTQGAGTIVAYSDNVKTNTRNLICQISNAGTTYIQIGNKALAAAGEAIGYLVTGSIEGYVDSNNNPSLNTAYKSAYVWDTNYFNVCINGTLGVADTSGAIVASGMTQMTIGSDAITPNDLFVKNGHIRSFKYFPFRLPNATLQSLTA